MPNNHISSRGATVSAQEMRSFISEQAGSKHKNKQARFDSGNKEIYRKSSGLTFNRGDDSKKTRHQKINGLKTQMLAKFGPSHQQAIKNVFAQQQTVALKNGTQVYKTAPTFAQLDQAIKEGDKQVVRDQVKALQSSIQKNSNFLSKSEKSLLASRISRANEWIEAGDLERAKLELNGEKGYLTDCDVSETSKGILARAESQAKKQATNQFQSLKNDARRLLQNYNVKPSVRQVIESQLGKAKSQIKSGDYGAAMQTMNAKLPGLSLTAKDLIGRLKQNSAPKNFPNGWHSKTVQNKVANMNKELVFGGDDGDCFYGAVAHQLGIPMTQVRQDLHEQALVALNNNKGNALIFGEIGYNELKEDIQSGNILQKGNAGDYRFAQLVADKYNRQVTMIDPQGNTRTFKPLNDGGQPAIVMAFNGGHFDAVVDKQPPMQPKFGYNNWQPQGMQYGNQYGYGQPTQQNQHYGLTTQQMQQLNTYY